MGMAENKRASGLDCPSSALKNSLSRLAEDLPNRPSTAGVAVKVADHDTVLLAAPGTPGMLDNMTACYCWHVCLGQERFVPFVSAAC